MLKVCQNDQRYLDETSQNCRANGVDNDQTAPQAQPDLDLHYLPFYEYCFRFSCTKIRLLNFSAIVKTV